MAFKVSIKDIGTEAALTDLREKLKNQRPALIMAGAYMKRETQLNFTRESDPDGNKWAPLKPSTLRYKRTNAILRDRSLLIGSVYNITRGKKIAEIGATKGYGRFHQTGTSKMAQRKFLGIGAQNRDRIIQIFQKHFSI